VRHQEIRVPGRRRGAVTRVVTFRTAQPASITINERNRNLIVESPSTQSAASFEPNQHAAEGTMATLP
jgi:hypothetical protein